MHLKKLLETENGQVEFTANLSSEEVQFLLEYAVNSLMQQGALPFMQMEENEQFSKVAPTSSEHH